MAEQVATPFLDSGPFVGTAWARWAITAVFAGSGVAISSYAVRTPSLKADHGLSAAQLGLLSTAFGVAAILAMQLTGGLVARLGSATVVRISLVLLPLVLVGIGLSTGFAPLGVAMVLTGAVVGILDVSMNAHAVAVERALGRPIMNGCHAAWSLGAVTGSLCGGAAASAGTSLAVHFLVVAAVLAPAGLVVGFGLLPAAVDRHAAGNGSPRVSWRTGWSRRVVVLGLMGATVLATEAGVANWSGVLLHEQLGASLGVASLGYIAFTGCETAGRLVGDRITLRYPSQVLVRAGTATAAVGSALVVSSRWPVLAIVGYAVAGLGLATTLPVIYSVVGHLGAGGSGAARSVARFSTMTYTGILLAPAIIGWCAQAVGLTWTLAALVPLLALASWKADAARR